MEQKPSSLNRLEGLLIFGRYPMSKKQLRNSELFVSEIGFGCMSLPLGDERASMSIIHEAIDRGVNFFDTADLYDRGKNEELIGKALHSKRSQVVLATKVGNRWKEGTEGWYWGPTKSYIKEQVHTSLKRLQTDYIDLYQLHGGTLDDPIDEIIEAFEELKEAGIIREYGISSIRPKVIEQYALRSNIVSVMSQYSILDRRPEADILPQLYEYGISLIARGPIAKGILSVNGANKISVDGYLNYSQTELIEVQQQLSSLTNEARSLENIAIKYVLSHPVVATAIPGASNKEQLRKNISSTSIPNLNEKEIAYIRSISKESSYS